MVVCVCKEERERGGRERENEEVKETEREKETKVYVCRVELLPSFKFTGKTVKKSEFTDNYQ